MSFSALDAPAPSPGLIGTVRTGYRLAVEHGRRVLAVLLPVLATGVLALTVLDAVAGRDHLVIVDGVAGARDDDGTVLAWARLAVVAACWLVGLAAAALVVTGAERGHAVRPARAVRAAVRRLPVYAAGLAGAAGAGLLLIWAAAGVAGGAGGPVGVAVMLAATLAAGMLAARMLLGLLTLELGGSAWALTRGRLAGTAGAFLLGGVAVPLLLAYLGDQLPLPGRYAQVLGALLLTAAVAAQAGLLATVYLRPRLPADDPDPDPRLAGLSGGPSRRPWIAAAVTVVALLAPAGVAAANPFGVPTVRSHRGPSGPVAVAWPAGGHPVIATTSGAWFCDDDACDRFTDRNGGPPAIDGFGIAAISADGGTVVKAALTGVEGNGGPFISYARCTRAGCPTAYLPVRASAKEAFGWPELGAAAAPDGSIWFVLAMPSADDAPGRATYRVTFIRCAGTGCARPERHDAGTVARLGSDADRKPQRVRLSIGADGRPVATVRTGSEAAVVTCDPVTCAAPRTAWSWVGKPGTPWAAPVSPTGPAVSYEPGLLRIGERMLPLPGRAGTTSAKQSGAVAAEGDRFYATAAEGRTPRPGLHLTVGVPAAEPTYWRQVLWRCDQQACRRQVLDGFDLLTGSEQMAAAADGRVLIARPTRVLLVSAPARD